MPQRPARRSEQALYRTLTQEARTATRARLVLLARLDPDGRRARTIAMDGTGTAAFRRALAAARLVRPGFRPLDTSFASDVNEHIRRAYQLGEPNSAPTEEGWRGVLDDRLVRLATTLGRLRYSFTCPLRVGDHLWGTLAFVTNEPLDEERRTVCLAIAGEAERIIGHAGDGMRLQHMAVIGRPLPEVFAFMTDLSRSQEWQSGLIDRRFEPPGPMRVGTRIADVRQVLGQRAEIEYEVTTLEPDRRFCYRSLPGPLGFEACVSFTPFASGTLVTVTGTARTGGFFRVAEPVVDRMVHRQFEADLGTLNDLLHARAE